MAEPKNDGRSQIITSRLAGLNAPERAPQARALLYLAVEDGPDTGQVFAVPDPGATIGRHADNAIVPNDPRLSRQHAHIEAQGASVVVRDLGSTNGTFLNGQRLDRPQPLRLGDLLQTGSTVFRVTATPPGGDATTGRAPMTTSRLRATTGQMPVTDRQEAKDCGVARTQWHERGASSQPVFELRRGRLYRTPWHELGPSQFPEYELRGTFLYRTAHHERGVGRTPDYELREGSFYRTGWHERGSQRQPEYQLA